ncbi:S1 RNA-binding domain-containing protein [Prochlorococcus marinus]|uniref:S1 RNA-binding domain-containing protein n=1 Tax=Prochlorococcus marinus TaxID=1219 RepID=UPI0022B452C5|nr:S1 RNA-binding domain-containing protein [Prochlorococcus marinus]
MAESGNHEPKRPNPPNQAQTHLRKPLQVLHISRKEDKQPQKDPKALKQASKTEELPTPEIQKNLVSPSKPSESNQKKNSYEFDYNSNENFSMGDLLDQETSNKFKSNQSSFTENNFLERSVDDFDFDEDAFLAALDENEPIGMTGEIAKGKVIGIESDGVYVDIGGKAPGFMPKHECGLGVITNLKELFPKGVEVEVLVTREQNADGMVTISCRALALRKSWETVLQFAKDSKVVQVKINGFNRGGLTCDIEGLRGFIPRSQLNDGDKHETLVGKTLDVAFIEVSPDNRKLILSEKKAVTAAKFAQLEIGQLVKGKVLAVKPYGFFVDIGGISGLLHQSMITNGSLRSLREVFNQDDEVKAVITDLDPTRGRIGLNTALLEGLPGEILIDKEKVLAEAEERAKKVKTLLNPKEDLPIK